MGASLVTNHNDDDDKNGIFFSFEVLLVTGVTEPRLNAFSSSTGEWAEVPCPAADYNYFIGDMMPLVDDGARANGCMYWLVHYWGLQYEEEHLLVLDTRTKEFSTMNLPWGKRAGYDRNIRVMRSGDDGELRIVALMPYRFVLNFWRPGRSRSSKGRWVKEDVVKFISVDGVGKLLIGGTTELCSMPTLGKYRMIDVGEGFVFFKHHDAPWVFALDLKEMKLHKLPSRKKYTGYALPYRMTLSPPLPNFGHH
uniref:F-box associated domain-containing protein n=1 Tax=Leersia perrieri TaxID=77586 RepID=A0A0D9XBK7_9ORYZ